jgi:hypothetical protein
MSDAIGEGGTGAAGCSCGMVGCVGSFPLSPVPHAVATGSRNAMRRVRADIDTSTGDVVVLLFVYLYLRERRREWCRDGGFL